MSSWFYKLRRRKRADAAAGFGFADPAAPPATPCCPNRASYYVPTRDRAVPPRRPACGQDNPKLRDTRLPPRSPRQPGGGDIVFDVVARRRDGLFDEAVPPELKLRPILTRPAPGGGGEGDASDSSFAASPTARVRRRRRFRARARRKVALPPRAAEGPAGLRWVYESLVVVKESADPEEDFLESMAEMMAANGVRSPRGLEELLACYLALNAADHHRAIVAAFRRAYLHRAPPPPPPPRERCLHARSTDRLAV